MTLICLFLFTKKVLTFEDHKEYKLLCTFYKEL